MKIALLLFILPFIIGILRLTILSPSQSSRIQKFLGDSRGILVCIGDVKCPALTMRKITIKGTKDEMHAQLLAVLLQLHPHTRLVISSTDMYKTSIKETLESVGFKTLLFV